MKLPLRLHNPATLSGTSQTATVSHTSLLGLLISKRLKPTLATARRVGFHPRYSRLSFHRHPFFYFLLTSDRARVEHQPPQPLAQHDESGLAWGNGGRRTVEDFFFRDLFEDGCLIPTSSPGIRTAPVSVDGPLGLLTLQRMKPPLATARRAVPSSIPEALVPPSSLLDALVFVQIGRE